MIKKRIEGNVKNVKIGKVYDRLKHNVKINPTIRESQKLIHIQQDKSLHKKGLLKYKIFKKLSNVLISFFLKRKFPIVDGNGE